VINGDAGFEQALAPARDNLWLMAGGRSLAGLKRLITRKDYGGEQTLAEALFPGDGRFDFVVVDTAPGWDALTINVLFYAETVLAPVSLEILALQGLLEFYNSLAAIQKYRSQLQLRYILPTFYDRRVKKSAEILAQLQSHFGERVCPPVRYNVRLSEGPGYGQSIFEYSPASTGAQDYQALVERILSDE
jgi:chromosome partitioning protein